MMKNLKEYKKTDFDYELDDEEAEMIRSMDDGHFKSVIDQKDRKKHLEESAQNFTEMGRKPVSIRIPEYNLKRIRRQAEAKGMPYQTLINSIIHQYLEKQKIY